jgi:polar amino acid transport system substrate-binding protein
MAARTCALLVALALAAAPSLTQRVQAQTQPPSDARELVIGTKVAAPFAMKEADGTWRGISIQLWQRVAAEMHLRYRFEETSLSGLVDGVAEGSLDAGVAALTVTGPRHRLVDFTQPFYSTGLGIAVKQDAGMTWWPIITDVFSFRFLGAVAALFAGSVVVGLVLWLLERGHNEHFGTHIGPAPCNSSGPAELLAAPPLESWSLSATAAARKLLPICSFGRAHRGDGLGRNRAGTAAR